MDWGERDLEVGIEPRCLRNAELHNPTLLDVGPFAYTKGDLEDLVGH